MVEEEDNKKTISLTWSSMKQGQRYGFIRTGFDFRATFIDLLDNTNTARFLYYHDRFTKGPCEEGMRTMPSVWIDTIWSLDSLVGDGLGLPHEIIRYIDSLL